MDILLLVLAAISLIGVRVYWKEPNTEYLSRKCTLAVNGVFVVLVFMKHFSQYISFGWDDSIYCWVRGFLGQLINVTFFFYSGYGIMKSIVTKGEEYRRHFFVSRFLKTWIRFAVVVLIYYGFALFLGKDYSILRFIQSLSGWKSVGNSNWYIFAIFALYIFTMIGFFACRNSFWGIAIIVLALSIGYGAVLYFLKDECWYNTILAYSCGMFFALVDKKFNMWIQRGMYRYVFSLLMMFILFAVTRWCRIHSLLSDIILYEMEVVCFMSVVLLITIRIKINNAVLLFLGKYAFEIYMLQRIPMILFENSGLPKYLYLVLCIMITVVLAVVFHFCQQRCSFIWERKR